jgi:tRNA pseudouridine55 synthase
MDGLLVIDKPAGPTSHDVVNRMRRVLGERRIGHAGTLDPAATGVLVLLVGRATRLAQFLSGSDKSYDAVVSLGSRTDTGDADGTPVGTRYEGPLPSRDDVERVLGEFRGTFLQRPPAFSAKHVGGTRSHRLARSARHAGTALAEESLPDPVQVAAHRVEMTSLDAGWIRLEVDCSAGFYIRSLAQDLGDRLGTGAHLRSLRRTRSGDFGLDVALTLDEAEREPARAAAAVLPMAAALPGVPQVTLTAQGVHRVLHGRDIGPAESTDPVSFFSTCDRRSQIRLLSPDGQLVAIGQPGRAPGLLHPLVVLG